MAGWDSIGAVRDWLESCGLSQTAQVRVLWTASLGLALTYAARQLTGGSSRKPEKGGTDFNSFLIEDKPAGKKKKATSNTISSNSFDAFLVQRKPVPVATSFDAFLKEREASDAESEPETSGAGFRAGPTDEQAVVTVLFGTEYGFAKEIAEKLCSRLLEGPRYWPRFLDMAEHPGGVDLTKEQALLVVCSTQGDGVAPSEAREFCDWLNSSRAAELPSTSYSVCALGDTSYQHFCACGKQLDTRLSSLKANSFVPRRDVNREDWKAVDEWLAAVIEGLDLLNLQTVAEIGYSLDPGGTSQQPRIGKSRPFKAEIVAVEGLCNIQSADDKDTLRVEIDLGDSGLEYAPGDALGIYASNAPEVVDDLLGFIDADPEELLPLPAWHFADDARPPGGQVSLRDLLTHCYDLRSPKSELLQLLLEAMPGCGKTLQGLANGDTNGHHGDDNLSNGHLNGIANGHAEDLHVKLSTSSEQVSSIRDLLTGPEAALERYLEPRHVADVLGDFAHGKISFDSLSKGLRPLQPRLYSISSSLLESPRRVQVTVAIVRYRSLQKERLGVASTFLAERIQVGEKLPVYVSKNPDFRLPTDPAKPIVMVGPGTGLAPFRAFMMERTLSGVSFGTSLLFFGCRRRDQDFLYGGLLEDWERDGKLELQTAFSRQQARKVYVQDRLRESSGRVWDLLEAGGHFYVCGDAAHMASDVEAALLDLIAQNQGRGGPAAEEYLDRLRKEERYQRDVWF